MSRAPLDIDVVIVSADTREMTTRCVDELMAHTSTASVVVVDNGSADGTAAALRARFGDRVDVRVMARDAGFAAACNAGADGGRAGCVLFLNSDILVTNSAVVRLLAALEEHGAVAAGGRLVDPDTLQTQAPYRPRRYPDVAVFATIVLGVELRWPQNPVTRRYQGADLPAVDAPHPVEQPAAAALLVRRAAFEAVAGFDTRFWYWFEDADLLRRLSVRGPVLYVPTAVFRHLGGATFARWSRAQRIRSSYHGMVQYAEAHFRAGSRRGLGLLLLTVSVPRLLRPRAAEEATAWRAVAGAGRALVLDRPAPALAPVGPLVRPGPAAGAVARGFFKVRTAARLRPAWRVLTRPSYTRTLACIADRAELAEVLNRRGLTGTAVEIGVQEGAFSEVLLDRWKGARLISVDPWLAAPRAEWDNTDNIPQDGHDALHAQTLERLERFGDRSAVWRSTGEDAAPRVAPASLDFVFIDARHDYPSVLDDVQTWFPKVRAGGIIAGHDYGDGLLPEGEFGVKSAVDAFFAPRGLPVHTCFNERYLPSWMVVVRR